MMARNSTSQSPKGSSVSDRASAAVRVGQAPELVTSSLPAVFDGQSRVLLLGTLPSPASRARGFHYANPQNRFWRVMAALWDEPVPQDNAARRSLLHRHRLALHDVLRSAEIRGASDASITRPVANDLSAILEAAPICRIFCTGTTAARLYRRYIEPRLGIGCVVLPSTSPANARWSLDDLVEAYGVVRDAAEAAVDAVVPAVTDGVVTAG